MQLPSLASKELSRLKEILPVPSHGSGLGGVPVCHRFIWRAESYLGLTSHCYTPSHGSGLGLTGHLSGGGMVEDKRTVDRRKTNRRTQERRDVERRFVFFDRLFKFLFASIVVLVAVWVYIFTK